MWNDERRTSGWYTPHTRPDGRATAQRRRLGIVVALLTALAVTTLLTACLLSVITPLLTQVFVTSPTATASRDATLAAAMTPTSADWFTFTNWEGGFQVDLPGVIGASHAYFINSFSGKGIDLYYMGAPISSPLQQREKKLWVKIFYSTKVTDFNICPQGGTPVKLGSGKAQVSAWVRDEGRIVTVNLVLNGTAIEILLDSRDAAQPALPRYGDIWRHILASFVLLPNMPHLTTHPCS